jgi:protein disulfide-isomerase
MKKTLITTLLLLAGLAVSAGEPEWLTDMDKAQKAAADQNKTILVNFTGSDWCGWCKRLDKEVFSKADFAAFASKELVLVKLDFPKHKKLTDEEKKANYALMKKYNVSGFPTIFLIDANGKSLLQTGYRNGGAEKYIEHLQEAISQSKS